MYSFSLVDVIDSLRVEIVRYNLKIPHCHHVVLIYQQIIWLWSVGAAHFALNAWLHMSRLENCKRGILMNWTIKNIAEEGILFHHLIIYLYVCLSDNYNNSYSAFQITNECSIKPTEYFHSVRGAKIGYSFRYIVVINMYSLCVWKNVCMRAYKYVYVCMHSCVHVCLYVCMVKLPTPCRRIGGEVV